MVDYRKFLRDKDEELVALYLGGLDVFAPGRTLRLGALPNVDPGAYVVRVTGRRATVTGPSSEAVDLSHLPKEVGHFTGGYLVLANGRADRIELLGAPEPEVLAPVRARRHESGALLLDEALFEGEVEAAARAALEEGRGLAGIKGVGSSLRGAFALATATRAAREANVSASPAELLKNLGPIAEGGPTAARAVLTSLEQARADERRLAEARVRDGQVQAIAAQVSRVARRAPPQAHLDPVERADNALTAAGARLLHARRLTHETLEVRFQFMGERFISVVHPLTLHVFDAGVCLAGADEEVTLESLPSVIREAIEEESLVITRH